MTINLPRYKFSFRPYIDGPIQHCLYRRYQRLRLLRQLIQDNSQYCAQCAVRKLSNLIRHFQGWSSRRLTQPHQHQGYNQPRNNMSQLHDAPGQKYHIPWTLHLQGWTRQQTSGLLPGTLCHKLLPFPMSLLRPRRPNDSTQPSFSKVWHCLSLKKPQDNYYNTANSASTRSLRTYVTHPTPMKSDDCAKESAKNKRAPRINVWRTQTPSASLDVKIYLETEENKISTSWFCVRLDLKSNIPIRYASPSLIAASPILATKTGPQVPSTFSIS